MSKRLTTDQRLTPEKLEAIRKRAEAVTDAPMLNVNSYVERNQLIYEDIPALLAEVERSQAAYLDMTANALWTAGLLRKEHKGIAYDAIDRSLGQEVGRV